MITLRGYQVTGVNDVRSGYASGKKRGVLVLPTGGGKTVIAAYITRTTVNNNKNVLFLAHRKELLEQCGDKLKKNAVDFGYLNPKYTPQPMWRTQVGTMQTVVKRMKNLNFIPDLIIIDECHRAMGKTYQEILNFYPKARVLGITATPIRGDGKPLGEFFDFMVQGPNIQELIDIGALVPPRTCWPDRFLDFSSVAMVKQEDGSYDYDKRQMEKIVNTVEVTGDVVEQYKKHCPGVPAVAFCVSIKHAYDVAAEFTAAGYIFKAIHGSTDKFPMTDKEREDILQELKDNKIHGITSVDLVTEGFDAPNLQAAIMLRKTASEGLYLQMVGRVLRAWPGKQCAWILDHVGVAVVHGTARKIRQWGLDTKPLTKKQRKDQEKLIKAVQCPVCFLAHDPGPVCPDCGHIYKPKEAVVTVRKSGQLVEVTEDQEAFINSLNSTPATGAEIKKAIRQAQTYEDLKMLGRKIGKDAAWARRHWENRNRTTKIA